MSHDKNMEELLVSARQLPAELSYDEVEFLFLNPTPPPPARPWWRGSYLKFLLMFTLLISLLAFFLPTQANVTEYQLSSFPVQLALPVLSFPTPQAKSSIPTTHTAPAAAPTPTNTPPTSLLPRTAPNDTKKTDRGEMPPALFQGTYAPLKASLMLTFQETEDSPVNILVLDLTKAEQRNLKQNKTSLMTIERAAGSLLLYRDGRDGAFEFLPNRNYQNDFAAKDWGPTGVSQEDGFFQVTLGKSTGDADVKRVEDQLWFRYFTANINSDYLDLLREYGYNGTDFEKLWKLANNNTPYQKLKEILSLSSAALTDAVPLEKLTTLNNDLDKLKDLRRSGERMSFAQFDAMKAEPSIWERLAKAQNPGLSIPAVDKYEAARKSERNLNFSTDRPGTTSDTIAYDGKTQLELIGNFDFRINKDTTQRDIIVYGPERLITKLRRKSDYADLRLVHKNKKEPLFVKFPLGSKVLHRSKKGVTMEVTTKPKRLR